MLYGYRLYLTQMLVSTCIFKDLTYNLNLNQTITIGYR